MSRSPRAISPALGLIVLSLSASAAAQAHGGEAAPHHEAEAAENHEGATAEHHAGGAAEHHEAGAGEEHEHEGHHGPHHRFQLGLAGTLFVGLTDRGPMLRRGGGLSFAV